MTKTAPRPRLPSSPPAVLGRRRAAIDLRQYRLALAAWLGRPVSQAELARAIGCRRQYVWAMEAGRRPVSQRAAEALGRWAGGLMEGR